MNTEITDAQGDMLYLKNFVVKPENFTIETVDMLMTFMKKSPSDRNLVLFHTGGGAIARVPRDATAFIHRDVGVVLQIKAIWHNKTEEEENIAWVDSVATAVAPNVSGAYVNYIDSRLENWQMAYYGDHYSRLLHTKNRVDPAHFFHFHQSIGAGELPDASTLV